MSFYKIQFKAIKTVIILTLSMPIMMMAQEEGTKEEPKFTLSGTADVYFRANLNIDNEIIDPTTGNSESVAPATSFANLGGFSLGMANIIGSYEGTKSGLVVDLVFGPRGSDAVFESPIYSNSGNIINQLYVYLDASESVTFTLGNFNTFLGYEVISPTANFNYSTSYMFSYGPFSHTGLKVDFDLGNDFTAMAAVLNPTDITEYNPAGDYFFGAQLGYGGFYLNTLLGEDYTQIDITGGIDISDEFYLGINATNTDLAGDAGFYGVALYNQYSISETFALGVRFEYFNDKDGSTVFSTGIDDTNVIDVTLSANINIGALTIIPEIRLDNSSENVFNDINGSQKNLSSIILAAAYEF